MTAWKDITGSQGSWEVRVDYADGTSQMLPTAHKEFWTSAAGRTM